MTGAVINYLQSNYSKELTVDISKLAEQLQVTPSIVSNVISNLDGYIKHNTQNKKTSAVSVLQGLLLEGKKLDFKSLVKEKSITNMVNFVSNFKGTNKKEKEKL